MFALVCPRFHILRVVYHLNVHVYGYFPYVSAYERALMIYCCVFADVQCLMEVRPFSVVLLGGIRNTPHLNYEGRSEAHRPLDICR